MLRLQSRATQLKHAAGSQLSQIVSGVRSKLPGRMVSCKYSTAPDTQLKEGPIKKLMVANRGSTKLYSVYSKCLDFEHFIPYLFCLFCLNFAFCILFFKILCGITNSVDSDQTDPSERSDLGLHCFYMPFCQKVWCRNVRTFTVTLKCQSWSRRHSDFFLHKFYFSK